MRVHRIHLRDYKGVDDAEVEFAVDGVTIVEGPNEVGKTSLAEALTLALEQLDSSTRADIRDAKPVHHDAGPWVEVELSTGPYRLIIEKRWLQRPITHLRVLEPRAEEITGREAHERLRTILAETLDEQLFRALHHYQGVNVEQAALGQSTSLASALDAAASGQSLAGQKEANLVDLVHAEQLRYFTPTGKPSTERKARSKELSALRDAADEVQSQLDALDNLADEHQSLIAEIGRLEEEAVCNQRLLNEESKIWESVQDKRVAFAQAASAHTTALAREHDVKRQVADRKALHEAEVSAASRRTSAEAAAETDRPAVEAARVAVQRTTEGRDRARQSRIDAEKAEQTARIREEFARRSISRELWAERLANVRSGRTMLTDARAILAANLMTEKLLAKVESASLAVTETGARLAASSAAVAVEALTSISISTGGGSRSLAAGEAFESRIEGALTFELNEIARVTVTGGSPERNLKEALEVAERQFRDLLTEANLPEDTTVAQCRLAAQQRRDSTAGAAQAEKLIADNLRDLTVERLEQEVAEDDAFICLFQQQYGADVDLPVSLDEARALLAVAEQASALAIREEEGATAEFEAARNRESELGDAISARATERQISIELHDGAVEALRLAREIKPDEVLEQELVVLEEASGKAADLLTTAESALNELDPDSVEARLANLRGVAARLSTDLREAEHSLVEVKTRLSLKGEEGLHDRLDELVSQFEWKTREHDRAERAARAADLLWERLIANREEAQRSYVAPYRAEIERLGRIVYGSSFAVEIDHSTLAIENRSLHGRTVPFARLSAGAKEQLCVIARLACAAIVAGTDGGGAPVIIDDALGWTDHDRLERIGAVFSAASHDCQVIVLTCDPSRYRSIGTAVVRHLRVDVDTRGS
ncbi:MAG: AAA family ATPase [Acidimicrobiales bacterium]